MTQVLEIDKYGNFLLKMSAICIFGVEELRNFDKMFKLSKAKSGKAGTQWLWIGRGGAVSMPAQCSEC